MVGLNEFTIKITKPTPDWESDWDGRHQLLGLREDTVSRLKV